MDKENLGGQTEESKEPNSSSRSLSLKELLNQGVENPFGLDTFLERPASSLQDTRRNEVAINVSEPLTSRCVEKFEEKETTIGSTSLSKTNYGTKNGDDVEMTISSSYQHSFALNPDRIVKERSVFKTVESRIKGSDALCIVKDESLEINSTKTALQNNAHQISCDAYFMSPTLSDQNKDSQTSWEVDHSNRLTTTDFAQSSCPTTVSQFSSYLVEDVEPSGKIGQAPNRNANPETNLTLLSDVITSLDSRKEDIYNFTPTCSKSNFDSNKSNGEVPANLLGNGRFFHGSYPKLINEIGKQVLNLQESASFPKNKSSVLNQFLPKQLITTNPKRECAELSHTAPKPKRRRGRPPKCLSNASLFDKSEVKVVDRKRKCIKNSLLNPKTPKNLKKFKTSQRKTAKRDDTSTYRRPMTAKKLPIEEASTSGAGTEPITLSISQIFATARFPTATIHYKSNGEMKLLPCRSDLRREKSPRSQDASFGDEQIECPSCKKFYEHPCTRHALALVLDNPVVRDGSLKDRARFTAPWPFVVKRSKIPEAGLGVWCTANIPKGLIFGPYEGRVLTQEQSNQQSGYSWMICRKSCDSFLVDAVDPSFSNWLRYINCGRDVKELNLKAFQFRGQIYYMTTKRILRGTELTVWYGEEYAKQLGILSPERKRICNKATYKRQSIQETKKLEKCVPDMLKVKKPPQTTPKMIPFSGKKVKSKRKLCLENFTIRDGPSDAQYPFVSGVEREKGLLVHGTSHPYETRNKNKSPPIDNSSTKGPQISLEPRNNCSKSVSPKEKFAEKISRDMASEISCDRDCLKCSKPFCSKSILAQQNREVHKKIFITKFRKCSEQIKLSSKDFTRNESDRLTPVGKYFCWNCSLKFENALHFLEHDLGHSFTSPVQCGLCHSRFNTFRDLRQHMSYYIGSDTCLGADETISIKPDGIHQSDINLLLRCRDCKALLKHTKNLMVIYKTHLLDSHSNGFIETLKDFNSLSNVNPFSTKVTPFRIKEDSPTCPLCFESIRDVKMADRHICEHSASPMRICDKCFVWFPSQSFLSRHALSHTKTQTFTELQTSKKDPLSFLPTSLISRLQMWLCEEGKKPSTSCDQLTTIGKAQSVIADAIQSPASLEGNKSLLISNKAEQTPSCDHNPVTNGKRKRGRKKKPLSCEVCCVFFGTVPELKEHKKAHKSRPKPRCSTCNEECESYVNLAQHKLTHAKPSFCSICQKTFGNLNLLKQHKEVHRKSKTFYCDHCSQCFRSKFSYFCHLPSHEVPQKKPHKPCNTSLTDVSSFQSQPAQSEAERAASPLSKNSFIEITVEDAIKAEKSAPFGCKQGITI